MHCSYGHRRCNVGNIMQAAVLPRDTRSGLQNHAERKCSTDLSYSLSHCQVKLLGLAHRLYQITTNIHNNTILWIIHAAIAPLNSLSCAIVYSLFVIIEHFHKEPQPDEARHNERDPLLRSELNIVDD